MFLQRKNEIGTNKSEVKPVFSQQPAQLSSNKNSDSDTAYSRDFKEFIAELSSAICKEILQNDIDRMFAELKNSYNKLENNSTDIKNKTAELGSQITIFSNKIRALADEEQKINKFAAQMEIGLNKVTNTESLLIAAIEKNYLKNIDNMNNACTASQRALENSIINQQKKASDALDGVIKNAINKYLSDITTGLGQAFDKTTSKIDTAFNDTRSDINTKFLSLSTKMDDTITQNNSVVTSAKTSIENRIHESKNSADSHFKNLDKKIDSVQEKLLSKIVSMSIENQALQKRCFIFNIVQTVMLAIIAILAIVAVM